MYPMEDIDLDYIRTTKFSFTGTVDLDCTPDQLFDVFEDPVSWTVWAGAIKKVEWTSPKPFGVGTTRTVTMVGGMEGYEEFIAWERGKHMAFKFTKSNKNTARAFGEEYVVTDLGDGRCQLKWTMAMTPGRIGKVSGSTTEATRSAENRGASSFSVQSRFPVRADWPRRPSSILR